ncbi:MAG: ABC transporter permease [Defluviicoccus sp.]
MSASAWRRQRLVREPPMPLTLEIALTHIRERLRQTVLSVLGVMTGVGFAVAMAALMQGSQEDFIRRIIDATPHITVRDDYRAVPWQPADTVYGSAASVALSSVKPKEELRGIRNPQPKLAVLADLPGVAVAPTLRGPVVLRYGGRDIAVSLLGIEPKAEIRVSKLAEDIREGTLDDLYTTANGIIIGSGLSRKLGANLGDSVSLSSSAGTIRLAKVVAIVHSGVVAIDDATAYARLKVVQVLLDRPNVINEIRLRLEDVGNARSLAQRIERRLGYRTESWEEINENVLEVFQIRNIIIYTVVGGILVVAAFGIFNIVSTIVFEKTRDIAILKSLGFTEGDVRAIFVSEGFLIGTAGTVLGWVLGFGLCRLLGSIEIKVRTFAESTGLPVTYDWRHYAIAAACALTAAGLAGYLPARRAGRLDPVAIIRGAA